MMHLLYTHHLVGLISKLYLGMTVCLKLCFSSMSSRARGDFQQRLILGDVLAVGVDDSVSSAQARWQRRS
jgi:hypothetical protein